MLLRYFYDKSLAQASYMIACQKSGDALVIDPARNIKPYLAAAMQEGLRITQVTETHIHADFVSGSRELSSYTGATLYLSDMGDAEWKYQFTDSNTVLLKDGDRWMVGNILVEVMATPGHTPEHLVFMITDTAAADRPIGVFTGDFVFVGTLGRPDLLEEAAGFANTKVLGARQQFQNMQRFKQLPDYLQIWPGHGAGSACGKGLGAIPSTTLGYEKLFNPAFQFDEEDAFVDWLLEGQPEPPRYFAQMKKVNKIGPALLSELSVPKRLEPALLYELLAQNAQVIDTRHGELYADAHLAGTLHIPATSPNFSTYAGWFVDYERPLYLIAYEDDVTRQITELQAIGVDNIRGYFSPQSLEGDFFSIPQINAEQLSKQLPTVQVIDVRGLDEYAGGHIANVQHIPLGYLPRYFDTISKDIPVVIHCQSGIRSQIAASLLRKHGFQQVSNLIGGIDAWQQARLPLEIGVAKSTQPVTE